MTNDWLVVDGAPLAGEPFAALAELTCPWPVPVVRTTCTNRRPTPCVLRPPPFHAARIC